MATVNEVQSELLENAERLAQQSQRMVRGHAVLISVAGLVLAAGVIVLVDALVRSEELGMRLLYMTTFLLVALFLLFKWLRPAWRFRPTELEVAQWIESHEPAATGLTSALELAQLPEDETRYGSQTYRRAALGQWAQAGYRPDWESYLDSRGWRRASWILLAVLAFALLGAAIWPSASWRGLQRLAMPWLHAPWPKNDVLEFRDPPQAIPQGSELQLEIIDLNPPLPIDVEVFVRERSEWREVYRVPASVLGNVAIANLAVVERNIEVAVRGGDFSPTSWLPIQVVRPPDLVASSFRVEPPEYSGNSPVDVTGKRVRVLRGSRVLLRGQLSEPVESIEMKLVQDEALETNQNELETSLLSGESSSPIQGAGEAGDNAWELRLADDGMTFTAGTGLEVDEPWVADRSLNWQMVIHGRSGLEIVLPELWTVEVSDDLPPRVHLKQASMKVATKQTQLKLQAAVEDDFGVVRVSAKARFVEQASEANGAGAQSDDLRRSFFEHSGTIAAAPRSWESEEIWDWSAADWARAIEPGTEIEYWVEAEDTLGQIGRSAAQRVRVAQEQEVLNSILEKQQKFFEHLQEVAASQRRTKQITTRTQEIFHQLQKLNPESQDSLSRLTQLQKSILMEIASTVGSSGVDGSLQAEVRELLRLLKQNRLETSAVAKNLTQTEVALGVIADQDAPLALAEAEQALRIARSDQPAALNDQFPELEASQTKVLEALEQLIEQMSRREAINGLTQELADVLRRQQELRSETDNLRVDQIAGAEREEVTRRGTELNANQSALARELEEAIDKIRSFSETNPEPSESDDGSERSKDSNAEDEAAETRLSEAASSIVDAQVSDVMRQSARQIRGDDLTDAVSRQDQAIRDLQTALSELDGNRSNEEDRSRQLSAASAELQELADQQQRLATELAAAEGGLSDDQRAELTERQAALAERTESQSRQLEDLGQTGLSEQVEAAGDSQSQASDSLEAGDTATARADAQRAAEQLREAAEQAASESEANRQEARQRDLFMMTSEIESLIERQSPIVEALGQVARALQESSQGESDIEKQIDGLVADQEDARSLLRTLRGATSELPAFDWALEKVEEDMSRAIAAGKRMRVEPEALEGATGALDRLLLAAEALDQAQEDSAEEDGAGQGESEQQDESGRLVPPLASLKLLRGLQAALNEETLALNAEPESPARTRKLQVLSAEQQALGERLNSLVEELSQGAEIQ